MVSNVDHNLGLLRTKLEELNLSENTVIIAMNDNGGTWGVDVFNGGMRGRKSHTLYGGIRAARPVSRSGPAACPGDPTGPTPTIWSTTSLPNPACGNCMISMRICIRPPTSQPTIRTWWHACPRTTRNGGLGSGSTEPTRVECARGGRHDRSLRFERPCSEAALSSTKLQLSRQHSTADACCSRRP